MSAKIRVSLVMEFDLNPDDYPSEQTYEGMYHKEVQNIKNNPEGIIDSMTEEGELKFEFIPDYVEDNDVHPSE